MAHSPGKAQVSLSLSACRRALRHEGGRVRPAAASLVIAPCRRSGRAGLILDPRPQQAPRRVASKCLPQITGAHLGVTEDTLAFALL
jgi:hypothetical protein